MPKCVVCKGYFEHGTQCPRCSTNNRTWLRWCRHDPVEQEGLSGLLAFTEPHGYLPLVVAVLATVVGLMSAFTLWDSITPGFRALALLVTPAGCLLSVQGIYEARMQIREKELLRQVRRNRPWELSAQAITLLLPAVAGGFVLVFMLLLIKIDVFWEFVKWLVLTEAVETGETLPEKVLAVMPVTSMTAYVALAVTFTASSSLMLARGYIQRLNKVVPDPIYLQEGLLTKITQVEAERTLQRPAAVTILGGEKDASSRRWRWDEMERLDTGGICLKATVGLTGEMASNPAGTPGRPSQQVIYLVKANPWGRITQVTRGGI